MSLLPRGLAAIHVAVALFGLAGLLGKLTTAGPRMIVFSRALLAALVLGGVLAASRARLVRAPRTLGVLGAAGVLLALHWLTFFQAIQTSTVAIGLLSYSSFPLFVTLLEPWCFKEPMRKLDLLTAGLVMCGLALVVPSYDLSNRLTQGAAWGVASGLTFALLGILSRKFVQTLPPVLVCAAQNAAASAVLLPFLRAADFRLGLRDAALLGCLGLFCTALAHGLFIRGLTTVRAQAASVISGLEPVYGIVLAAFCLGEIPGARTLLGGLIILAATLLVLWGHPSPAHPAGGTGPTHRAS